MDPQTKRKRTSLFATPFANKRVSLTSRALEPAYAEARRHRSNTSCSALQSARRCDTRRYARARRRQSTCLPNTMMNRASRRIASSKSFSTSASCLCVLVPSLLNSQWHAIASLRCLEVGCWTTSIAVGRSRATTAHHQQHQQHQSSRCLGGGRAASMPSFLVFGLPFLGLASFTFGMPCTTTKREGRGGGKRQHDSKEGEKKKGTTHKEEEDEAAPPRRRERGFTSQKVDAKGPRSVK